MDVFEGWLDFCGKLSTGDLFAGLQRLNDKESRSLAQIIGILAELRKRRAADDKGYPSLFRYCTKVLGYSEDQACMRIRAAQAAAKFPSILRLIASRSLGITAISRLAPHLDSANHRSVLARAAGKGLDDVDRLVRTLAPQVERRPVIRALSTGSDAPALEKRDEAREFLPQLAPAAGEDSPIEASAGGIGPCQAASGIALSSGAAGERVRSGRVLFNFVVSERFRAKFERARELLRHKFPDGGPEGIFEDALDGLLERKDPWRRLERKRKRGEARERRQRRQARSRPAGNVIESGP